jgi:hypothetical protein
MFKTLFAFISNIRLATAKKTDLMFEIAALRHQLQVLQRCTKRPKIRSSDRVFWIWLSRNWAKSSAGPDGNSPRHRSSRDGRSMAPCRISRLLASVFERKTGAAKDIARTYQVHSPHF